MDWLKWVVVLHLNKAVQSVLSITVFEGYSPVLELDLCITIGIDKSLVLVNQSLS